MGNGESSSYSSSDDSSSSCSSHRTFSTPKIDTFSSSSFNKPCSISFRDDSFERSARNTIECMSAMRSISSSSRSSDDDRFTISSANSNDNNFTYTKTIRSRNNNAGNSKINVSKSSVKTAASPVIKEVNKPTEKISVTEKNSEGKSNIKNDEHFNEGEKIGSIIHTVKEIPNIVNNEFVSELKNITIETVKNVNADVINTVNTIDDVHENYIKPIIAEVREYTNAELGREKTETEQFARDVVSGIISDAVETKTCGIVKDAGRVVDSIVDIDEIAVKDAMKPENIQKIVESKTYSDALMTKAVGNMLGVETPGADELVKNQGKVLSNK